MSTLLGILGVVAAVALLWAGLRKSSWRSPVSAILSVLDILALTLAIAQLGWWGFGLFLLANAIGFLGWGVAGALVVQQELATARAFNPTDPDRVPEVHARLKKRRELGHLDPRQRARLVRLLCQRHRDTKEIEHMAPPIAVLWNLADKPELEWLVERFDTIHRLWGTPASDAERTADIVAAGALQSPASISEMLEALAVAGGGSPSAAPSTTR